ncbi:sugar ABC transporter permease [Acholeplasma manati]|uniref:Sugar ABC transporter permease n=1 Tax=Paracholeplasma manati TaxID=591373 RepID=A0ABT2Y474_9MOLU|nr:sugar ABC transporter permease [Paracholeplasma manati]MCV2231529.1 sugar ABC transporter permease [Paracholeplasma manati]
MRKLTLNRRHREWLFGYVFIGIWVLGFFVFTLYPIVQSMVFSTKDVRISSSGLEIIKDLGFTNFQNAFTYIYFIEALWKYISNTLITIPAIVVFSIVIGLLLNQKIKLRGIFRTIYFLPVIISSGPVLTKISGEGAMTIPSLDTNGFIGLLQNNLPVLLADGIAALFSKIVLIMWFTGVPVIIVIAGLQKIDKAIYEAASIDGASIWESFWKITLPSIKPLINIIIVFSIVNISVFSSNEIMLIIDQRKLTQYGLANAFSWIYFTVTMVLLMGFLGILNLNLSIFRKKRVSRQVRT